MTIDSGEISGIVAVLGVLLSIFHITGVDANTLTGLVNGVVCLVTVCAACYSVWSHHQKNTAATA